MLRGGSVVRLQALRAEEKGWRSIARKTGHSKKKINLRDKHPIGTQSRTKRPKKLEPVIPHIEQWMRMGLFICEAMKQRLVPLGYPGGVSHIKGYVRSHRPPRQPQAKIRYETKPGQQAQIDWGFCKQEDESVQKRKGPYL